MRILFWGIVLASLIAVSSVSSRRCNKKSSDYDLDNHNDGPSGDGCADAKAAVEKLKNDIEAEKKSAVDGRKQLDDQLAKLKERSNDLQKEFQKQQAQLQALQAAQENAKGNIVTIKNITLQVQSLQGTNVQLKSQITAFELQVETLSINIKQSEADVLSLKSQLQAAQGVSADKDAELLRLKAQLQELEQVKVLLDQTAGQVQNLKTQVNSLISQVSTCTSSVQTKTSAYQQCQQSLTNVRNQVNAVPAGCTSQRRAGGRCKGQYVRWTVVNSYHEVSFDVSTAGGQNHDSCRQLCFNDARCESADFLNGVCYLNGGRAKLNPNPPLVLFTFDCC